MTILSTTRLNSPFAPIFAANIDQVPLPFRRQFLHTPETPQKVWLEGEMERIWFQPRWLKPLFWILAKGGILLSQMGEHVPTKMDVGAYRADDGQPYHTWNRLVGFAKPETFNTTLIYQPEMDRIADLVGPADCVHLLWHAQFKPPSTFTLDTAACAIGIAGRRLWLPKWLWRLMFGVVRFQQHALIDADNMVTIELIVAHPLFGDVFGYKGTFQVREEPIRS